jgi:RNA polymerase sigma factor (sigma-70 family)
MSAVANGDRAASPRNRMEANDLRIIRRQTRLIVRRVHANKEDAQDFEQEVCCRWLASPATFDATKGSREAYLATFTAKTLLQKLRHRFTQKRDRRRCRSLNIRGDEGSSSDVADFEDARRPQLGRCDLDLKLDLEVVLRGLPPEQRELAELLMIYSPAEVAARRNMQLSSLQRRIAKLGRALQKCGLKKYWQKSA